MKVEQTSEISNYFDLKLLRNIQDKFSSIVKLPIFTVDLKGNTVVSSGKLSGFCSMIHEGESSGPLCRACRKQAIDAVIENKKKISFYNCKPGLMNVLVPLSHKGKVVGGVICEGILFDEVKKKNIESFAKKFKIDSYELSKEFDKLDKYDKDKLMLFGAFSYILSLANQDFAQYKQVHDRKFNKLTLLSKFNNKINTLDVQAICEALIHHIEKVIEKSNVSLNLGNGTRYFLSSKLGDKAIADYEDFILKDIQHSKEEFTKLSADDELGYLHAIPLILNNEVIGTINIYDDDIFEIEDDESEYIKIMANNAAMAIANAKHYEDIKQLAMKDNLTQLYNRNFFMNILDREIIRTRRTLIPFSVFMIDIDNFKNYNDCNGHQNGDKLIQKVSDLISTFVREIDIVGRYGGEEFIVILPETDFEMAKFVAERVRGAIAKWKFPFGDKQPTGNVTVSVGSVTVLDTALNKDEIIEKADTALYQAKTSGRNKVCAVEHTDPSLLKSKEPIATQ